jgi:hypothetical protein
VQRPVHRPFRRPSQRTGFVESLHEAAIPFQFVEAGRLGGSVAPGTRFEIQVRHPATTHCVSLAQLRRWVEGIAVSPDETLKKRRLKALLAG